MIGRRAFVALGASAWLSASVLSAPVLADDVGKTLAAITKARAPIKTLQSNFQQKRVIGLLATAVKSKGRLTLVRPDRLRWELFAPDAVTYWIGPKGLAMKSADGVTKMGPAAAGRFGVVLTDLLTLIGGDLTKLRKRYDFSVKRAKSRITLIAKPKDKRLAKQIAELRMTAPAKQLWQVERVEIHERSGDKSFIDFAAFVRNKPVKRDYMKP